MLNPIIFLKLSYHAATKYKKEQTALTVLLNLIREMLCTKPY